MPVSHLGLTVSHLPSAVSFYQSALQPLGYKYFGSQGDSIGLGVTEADFFLTQAHFGVRPTPTHIAFHAADCLAVRDCFKAALRAGGTASGKPNFRKDDCRCFNAAVEDLDGNTVEFIWRDNSLFAEPEESMYSRQLPVRSKTQSTYCEPVNPRSGGLTRSRTEPVDGFSSKALLGAALGVAAGAAFAYAVVRSEKDGSRAEARHSMWSRSRESDNGTSRPSRRSASAAASDRMSRGFGAIEAASNNPRLMMPRSYADDGQVEYRRQRVTRTSSGRSQTRETVTIGPGSFATRRSTTMPVEQSQYLLLDDRKSSRTSRRASLAEDKRHDSVVSKSSYHSHRTAQPVRQSFSQTSTVKPSRRSSVHVESAARVPLPASVAVSRARTKVSTRYREPERFDAYYLPVDTPNTALRADQIDDDGLDDMRTIVPDDSISCIDLPKSYHTSRSKRSDRYRGDESRASRKGRSQYSAR